LPSHVAESAIGVPQDEVEAAKTGLNRRNRTVSASAILLAIEREVT
jgi:hypothetical protein